MIKLLSFLTLPLFIIDQVTKVAVLKSFVLHEHAEIIPGFFNLVRVHNTGIAFGKFNEGAAANIIFTFIAIGALIAILIFWRRGHFPGKLNGVAVALLISGIIGNLTDRLWHGYVVDFLDFYIADHHWPSFNVADSCICIAAGLLFIAAFRTKGDDESIQEKTAN